MACSIIRVPGEAEGFNLSADGQARRLFQAEGGPVRWE